MDISRPLPAKRQRRVLQVRLLSGFNSLPGVGRGPRVASDQSVVTCPGEPHAFPLEVCDIGTPSRLSAPSPFNPTTIHCSKFAMLSMYVTSKLKICRCWRLIIGCRTFVDVCRDGITRASRRMTCRGPSPGAARHSGIFIFHISQYFLGCSFHWLGSSGSQTLSIRSPSFALRSRSGDMCKFDKRAKTMCKRSAGLWQLSHRILSSENLTCSFGTADAAPRDIVSFGRIP